MPATITLGEVAELVGGELRGDGAVEIRSVAPIAAAQEGDLTWLTDTRHSSHLPGCQASGILIAPNLKNEAIPAVVCQHPELALASILQHLQPPMPHPPSGIDPSASVAADVQLGNEVAIGPRAVIQRGVTLGQCTVVHAGVFIGEGTAIGEHCVIWPNVVIRERCRIGHRVTIQANSTIGADGFGYNFQDGQYRKIPHIGGVRLGDDVEIGANCCIDRAKCGETVIGRGTKIDNLVQIAHNVKVGEDCCIIAQAGIAGSTVLGNHVVLAGKVGVKDNVKIGSGVQAAACSCIASNISDGEIVVGIPARPKDAFFREHSAIKRLPLHLRRIRELAERVQRLEAANDPKAD